MALKENVLDLTHFAFVHPARFEIMEPAVTLDGNRVAYGICGQNHGHGQGVREKLQAAVEAAFAEGGIASRRGADDPA